jgi:heme/copper-type cytochrome/quinol oxidase subunit 1
MVSSIGSFISGFGVLIFIYCVIDAFACKRKAGDNPWGAGATTLEWTLSSPRRSTSSRCCRGCLKRTVPGLPYRCAGIRLSIP